MKDNISIHVRRSSTGWACQITQHGKLLMRADGFRTMGAADDWAGDWVAQHCPRVCGGARENPGDSVLLHGTLRKHAPLIRRQGLVPKIGAHMGQAYGYGEEVRPLVFAASPSSKSWVGALWSQVGLLLKKNNVSTADVLRHGMIVVVPRREFRCSPGGYNEGDDPYGVEPADWYTRHPVKPLRLVMGRAMVPYLQRATEDWPECPGTRGNPRRRRR